MRKTVRRNILWLVLALAIPGVAAYAGADVSEETVASVDGDRINGRELREALGLWGGAVSATGVPVEKKKEALDRLITGRLLEHSARGKGLDTKEEYRERVEKSVEGLPVPALIRKEAAARMKINEEEVRKEAATLRKADKKLSKEDARLRAKGMIWEREMKRLQEELIETSRKEASAAILEEVLGSIGKGEKVEDNAVLGTAYTDTVTYGDVKRLLAQMGGGRHGGQDLSSNPAAVRNVVNRELTMKSLARYARNRKIEESGWMKTVRRETERAILIDLLMQKVILKKANATDKEIEEAYARHSQMLVRNGKKIPLPEVKEEIRRIVQNEKRKKAADDYIEKLKKKSKITINSKVLSNI